MELNDEQRAAVEAVVSREGYATYVLFGVTGSGKTEVYLHLIEETLKKHPTGQVLLLVPEINLTPQLEARVRGRFVDELVVTMHSNLTPKELARRPRGPCARARGYAHGDLYELCRFKARLGRRGT